MKHSGTINLNKLHNHRDDLFNGLLDTCGMFRGAADHYEQPFMEKYIMQEAKELAQTCHIDWGNHKNEIFDCVQEAMKFSYIESLEGFYYKALKTHVKNTIKKLKKQGFKVFLINDRGQEVKLKYAQYLRWAISANKADELNVSWALKNTSSIEKVADFISCLEVLHWEFINGLNKAGDHDNWDKNIYNYTDFNEIIEESKEHL